MLTLIVLAAAVAGCARFRSRVPADPATVAVAAGSLRLAKTVPPEVTLGSNYLSELTLTVRGDTTNVVVRDELPENVVYLRSEPPATVEGQRLLWNFGNLTAGQVMKAQVWLQANREGVAASCATVNTTPQGRVCAETVIGRAELALETRGPATALLGEEVVYELVIRNPGSATARGVVATVAVPAGFTHSSGKQSLRYELRDLVPGRSEVVSVAFRANQRGKICVVANVSSTNAPAGSAEACTVVLVPALQLDMNGTKEQILGRNADYEIVVSNTGDTVLREVIITDTVPPETTIVAAPGALLEKNKATWVITNLVPGTKITQTLKLTSKLPGTHCATTTVTAGRLSDSTKACTFWRGIPAVGIQVSEEPDPIQIGESTAYHVKVINQGFADLTNVKVDVAFTGEVAPTAAVEGTVTGQKVTFPVIAGIKAKQSVTLTISVKGVRPGDARSRVVLTCDQLKTPVQVEESTTVY